MSNKYFVSSPSELEIFPESGTHINYSRGEDKVYYKNYVRPDEILYTTTDGNPININFDDCPDFRSIVISNTYQNGQGIIKCNEIISCIDDYSLSDNENLKTVHLSSLVCSIGVSSFSNCPNLEYINLEETRVDEIYDQAFLGCTKLTNIKFPETLEFIDFGAFEGCTGLQKISSPPNLLGIDENAFSGCTNLREINLPEGLEIIRNNAFNETKISSIDFPSSIISLGDYIFSGGTCYDGSGNSPLKLVKINFEVDLSKIISSNALHNSISIPYNEVDHFYFNSRSVDQTLSSFIGISPKSVVFSPIVESIEMTALSGRTIPLIKFLGDTAEYCFSGINLGSVSFYKDATFIPEGAFSGCKFLKKTLELPSKLVEIKAGAFFGADLRALIIPSTVHTIDNQAFFACFDNEAELFSIGFSSATPPTLGEDVFSNQCDNFSIIVPGAYKTAYKTAWPQYADYIYSEDDEVEE